jgi:hypothetical protein
VRPNKFVRTHCGSGGHSMMTKQVVSADAMVWSNDNIGRVWFRQLKYTIFVLSLDYKVYHNPFLAVPCHGIITLIYKVYHSPFLALACHGKITLINKVYNNLFLALACHGIVVTLIYKVYHNPILAFACYVKITLIYKAYHIPFCSCFLST